MLRRGVNRNSKIDPYSIMVSIQGETPIQTFLEDEEIFEQITNEICVLDLPSYKDDDQVVHDNPQVRRLYRTIVSGNRNS